MHFISTRPVRAMTLALILMAAFAMSIGAHAKGARTIDEVAAVLVEHVQTGDRELFAKVFDTKAHLARVEAAGGSDPAIRKNVRKRVKNLLSFMDGPKVGGYDGGDVVVVQTVMEEDAGRIVLREDQSGGPRYVEFLLHADKKGRPRVIDWIRLGENAYESREFVIRDGFIERDYPQIIAGIGLEPEPGDVEALGVVFAPRGERIYDEWLTQFRTLPERYQQNKYLLMWWLTFNEDESDEVRIATLEEMVTLHGQDFEMSMHALEYFARTAQWPAYDEVINRLIERWGEDAWLVAQRDAEASAPEGSEP